MREYIMSVIGAGILCSFSQILAPDKWKKYIKLVTGVIIAIIMISPIKKIDMSIFDIFTQPAQYDIDESMLKKTVKKELEVKISKDVKMRIKEKFGCESEVKVTVETDGENNVIGIEKIEIKTSADSGAVVRLISEAYELNKDRVKINGR